jgi:NSS family neurotransmitter:Na+ symporter
VATDSFYEGLSFMLWPDFSEFTWEASLVALGHAFFTLSIGLGAMMAYGSYLPQNISITRAAVTVTLLDTGVALLAGLVIFPVTFAYGLEQSAGPGLIFVSLPIAFGEMPGGQIIGTLFFLFLVLAALTSSISLMEPTVEYLVERAGVRRLSASIAAGSTVWLLGIATALSFNLWSDIKLFDKNIFDLLDFLTANIMLPLGGLFIALFTGWVMSKSSIREELGAGSGVGFKIWHFVLRYMTPLGVIIVFIYNLL